jgi:hypothetical protein
MLFFIVHFFALILLASVLGRTVDSRDGADWSATADGRRQPKR